MAAVGEIGALTATGFTLNLNGVLTLGGAGGFGELRGFVGTDTNVINLNGGVTLANDGRINAGDLKAIDHINATACRKNFASDCAPCI